MERPRPIRITEHQGDDMNRTEAAFASFLNLRVAAGYLVEWHFQAVNLRLASMKCWYKPDFLVVLPTHLRICEVKGFWRDDARVKWKVAAELFPAFEFVAVTADGWVKDLECPKNWIFETFRGDKVTVDAF